MSVEDAPIVKLVNVVLITAIRKQARYISMMPGRVWQFRKGAWYDEMRPPVSLHTTMIRRLSIMLGSLAPGRVGEYLSGGIHLRMGIENPREQGYAVYIERTLHEHSAFHRAFLELVTPQELAARRPLEPHFPKGHPIPGFSVIGDPYRGSSTTGPLFTDAIAEPYVGPDGEPIDLDAMFGEIEDALLK